MKAALFALALPLLAAGGAQAMPLAAPAPAGLPIEQVQMQCDYNRCIDVRTGVYTQSTCNRRGCFPLGGPRGQIGAYGEDNRYYRRRGYDDGYYGGGYYRGPRQYRYYED
jgi:hypothetical protein